MDYATIAKKLSIIPYAAATLLLGALLVLLVPMVYITAYAFIPIGFGIIALSIYNGSISGVIIGFVAAGFGGLCYEEWFGSGDVTPISEIPELVASMR